MSVPYGEPCVDCGFHTDLYLDCCGLPFCQICAGGHMASFAHQDCYEDDFEDDDLDDFEGCEHGVQFCDECDECDECEDDGEYE